MEKENKQGSQAGIQQCLLELENNLYSLVQLCVEVEGEGPFLPFLS